MGCFGEVTVEPQPLAVGVEPLAQGRPLADERSVGHFDSVLAGGDQAGISQAREHFFHLTGISLGRPGQQFVVAGSPPSVLSTFTQFCEAQKNAASDNLLLGPEG
jgi:hypothetical protein